MFSENCAPYIWWFFKNNEEGDIPVNNNLISEYGDQLISESGVNLIAE